MVDVTVDRVGVIVLVMTVVSVVVVGFGVTVTITVLTGTLDGPVVAEGPEGPVM